MAHDALAFRARYRAGISRWYNPWLHGGFVLLYGLGFIWLLGRQLAEPVRPWQWLAIPAGLLLCNWGEYSIHKNLGHFKRRLAALFYQRHTGDHHSFFVEGRMVYDGPQDWRVILFPPWLIVLFSLIAAAAWYALSGLDRNVATLFAQTLIGGYLAYEIAHACEHLPDGHWLAGLPGIRQMRRLHALHHRRDLMRERNFNIVFPLTDWLRGTLYWEPEEREIEPRKATVMRHEVSIAGSPAEVLAYASAATRWPEWHPSSLRVDGAAGPMGQGARFEEDIHAGGRHDHLRWRVDQYAPAARWQASAWGGLGLRLQVSYEVEAQGAATRFVRTLHYQVPAMLRMLDALVLRRRIERESALSMTQLRQACERRQG